jgi:hypothetical protein
MDIVLLGLVAAAAILSVLLAPEPARRTVTVPKRDNRRR